MKLRKLSLTEGAALAGAMFSQLIGPGAAQADTNPQPVRESAFIENVKLSPGAKVKGLALNPEKTFEALKKGEYNAKVKATVGGAPSYFNVFTKLDGQDDLGLEKLGLEVGVNPRTGNISGPFKLGATKTKTTLVTDPNDPRMAAAKPGEHLVEHAFSGLYNLGVNFQVPVGGTPVSLGLRADGGEQTVLVWRKLEKSSDILSTFKIPVTVADLQAQIRGGEGFDSKGEQTVGLGGSVVLGYATSGVRIGAGASVYYPVTGNLVKSIDRDPANTNLWHITLKQVDTSSIDRVYTLDAGLHAGSLGVDGLVEKAAGALANVAKVGMSYRLQDLDQEANLLKVTVDDRTPGGELVLSGALIGDFSWAQRLSGYRGSGVTMERSVDTNVAAHTQDLTIKGLGLKYQDISKLLERTDEIYTQDSYVKLQSVDRESGKTFRIFDPVTVDRQIRFVDRQQQEMELPAFTGDFTVALPPPPKFGENSLAGHDSTLAVDVAINSERTGGSELYRALGGVIRALETLNTNDTKGIEDLQRAIAGGVKPEYDPFLWVFSDKSFDKVSLKLGAKVAPEGFASFLAPNGVPRSQQDFERLYLNATGALRLPVSEVGIREAIARTLQATVMDRNGVIEVAKDAKVIGTLTAADLQAIQDELVKRVGDDVNLTMSVGKWNGPSPMPLISVSEDRWSESDNVVSNAKAFGEAAMKVQELWLANQAPVRGKTEGEAGYQARLESWKNSSLYYRPGEYSAQLLEAVKEVLKVDPTTFPAFALISGTDPEFVQVEAKVDVKEKVVRKMLTAGAENMQQFAAARLLLEANASFNADIDLITLARPPTMGFDQVKAAAKALFPDAEVKPVQMTNVVQIKVNEFRSDEQREALGSFLAAVRIVDGQLKLADAFDDADARRFAQVAGPKAWFQKGADGYQLLLDNHGHSYVQIQEATKNITKGPLPLMYPSDQATGVQATPAVVKATFKAGYQGARSAIDGEQPAPGSLQVNGMSKE